MEKKRFTRDLSLVLIFSFDTFANTQKNFKIKIDFFANAVDSFQSTSVHLKQFNFPHLLTNFSHVLVEINIKKQIIDKPNDT